MAHSAQTQINLRNSYVNEQVDLKLAASMHGVSYGTARNWKKTAKSEGDDWDTARNAMLLAQGGKKELMNQVLERFFIQSERIFLSIEQADNMKPEAAVDLMAKWSDSVSKISKHLGTNNNFDRIGCAMELLQMLASFVRENYPQHAAAFLEILEPFGQEVSRQYG
jgi:hypothetical protein